MPTIESARTWYPEVDPVHGFDHILRVYRMVGKLATAEGADLEIVQAAALLHDAQGSQTSGGEEVASTTIKSQPNSPSRFWMQKAGQLIESQLYNIAYSPIVSETIPISHKLLKQKSFLMLTNLM